MPKFTIVSTPDDGEYDNSDLRDYQKIAVQEVEKNRKRGITRQVIELPTGCGKTHIFGAIARNNVSNGRVVFVAHRAEIVDQTARIIQEMTEISPGIVMANRDEYNREIVISSIMTVNRSQRRQRLIDDSEIVALVIDEVHHYRPDNAYGKLVDATLDAYPECLVVGLSATPYRNDGIKITDHFEPVFVRTINRMQKDGWLCDIDWQRQIIPSMHLEKIATSTSSMALKDYMAIPLAREVGKYLPYIAENSSSLIGDRQTVVYACNLEHMELLESYYRDFGYKVRSIDGTTPAIIRENTLAEWRQGNIQIVVNVGVLTEGFDYPGIEAVIIARPTMSPGLYTQMIGRGLRLNEGKNNCLIVDYTGRPSMSKYGFMPRSNIQITLQDITGIRSVTQDDYEDQFHENERRLRLVKGWSSLPFIENTVTVNQVDYQYFLLNGGPDVPTFAIVEIPNNGLAMPLEVIKRDVKELHHNGMTFMDAVGMLDEHARRSGMSNAFINPYWHHRKASDKIKNTLQKWDPSTAWIANNEEWDMGKYSDALTRIFTYRPIRNYLTRKEYNSRVRRSNSRNADDKGAN